MNNKILTAISAKIAEYDELERLARERGNISMTMMYINQKIGLLEAYNIAAEVIGGGW